MVSAFGYTTEALLESYAKRDYSAIDGVNYLTTQIEQTITDAEYFINGYTGNDTGWVTTIPNDIKLVTKMVAKIFMDNDMIEKNIGEIATINGGVIIDVLERYDIMLILDKYKDEFNAVQGIFISKHTHNHNPRRSYYWP